LAAASELRVITRHAGSIWIGQLAVMAFGVTDTLVAGRHSDAALAALSVGSAVYISVFVALMAVLQALLPIWAELQGARRLTALGRSVRQALYLCAITAVLGLAALLAPGPMLRWTGVPLELRPVVESYLSVLAIAFVPALLFRMYGTLNQSLGRPLLVTLLQIGALLFKIPLSIGLAFGMAGLEPMGAVGCAWATVVVNVAMLLVATLLLRTQPLYRPYRLWEPMEAPHWESIVAFIRLGVPTGLAVMVEVTSFTLMALFIARQGVEASAAHQIASNLVAVLYMMPLSLGIAVSARVSYWLGAAQPERAIKVIFKGFVLVALTASVFSAILLIANKRIAGLYSSNPDVIRIAEGLLIWIACFHLADSLQAVSSFVLRSYRVTVAPLLIYTVLLWGLGLCGAYFWAYVGTATIAARPSPETFWIWSTIALALTALVLMRLLTLTVRRAHPGQ
jgi:multidrug resistance protein, MATE family